IQAAFMAALVATGSLQTGAPVLALPATPPASVAAPGVSVRTVTLVTGDRVTVVIGQHPSIAAVTPAKGRERVSFAVSQFGNRLRVVPSDAAAGLAAGRLDPRLFDVSTLLGFGYDDRRGDLPLIVRGTAAAIGKGLAAQGARQVPGGKAWKAKKNELATWWQG